MQNGVISKLREFSKHDTIQLTSRGNTAIFAALYLARKSVLDENHLMTKKNVLIPDQGGWLTYDKYAKMLELTPISLKTDAGIIDLEGLKSKVNNACCLIYSQPAGYFASQPIEDIYRICKGKCLVIMDVSGSIGSALCKGDFADILVGSFGLWKPVNLHYGGFLSVKERDLLDQGKEIFNTDSFDEEFLPSLRIKLDEVADRYKQFFSLCDKVKKDLVKFNIIHKDKKGIVVIIRFKSDEEKSEILKYCEQNGFEYTLCPRYIRVMEKAVSIEVKRLV